MLDRLGNRQRCAIRVLVETLPPYKGRVYDPCCGSASMFVQSEKFVEAHGGRSGDIAVYGQKSNSTTRRLATKIGYSEVVTICDRIDEPLTRRSP